ncbi:unnamed protein product [Discosporangium mesarthrocarpum]
MGTLTVALAVSLGVVSGFVAPSSFAGPGLAQSSCARASRSACRPSMAVIEVSSEEELDSTVGAGGLVVVDYSTTWCGPCKVIFPKFEELSDEFKDAVFLKVIGDSSTAASKLMKREGVRSVPSFHFWKDGNKVDSLNGANAEALESTIRDLSN